MQPPPGTGRSSMRSSGPSLAIEDSGLLREPDASPRPLSMCSSFSRLPAEMGLSMPPCLDPGLDPASDGLLPPAPPPLTTPLRLLEYPDPACQLLLGQSVSLAPPPRVTPLAPPRLKSTLILLSQLLVQRPPPRAPLHVSEPCLPAPYWVPWSCSARFRPDGPPPRPSSAC